MSGGSVVARILGPFYLSDRALRRELVQLGANLSGTLVDVGCGAQPYRGYFQNADYIGLEVLQRSPLGSEKRPDLLFDGLRFPLVDGCVENVLCTQVLEHVFEPGIFLDEIFRILAPDGALVISVPFLWDEHEQPYDYARYSSFGLRYLARKHGFRLQSERKTLADASVLVQLSLTYLYKVTRRLPEVVRKPLLALLSLPGNLCGLAIAKLLPRNPDLYLDNVMVWVKNTGGGQDNGQ